MHIEFLRASSKLPCVHGCLSTLICAEAAITLSVFQPASIASRHTSCSSNGAIPLGTSDLLSGLTKNRQPSLVVATDTSTR